MWFGNNICESDCMSAWCLKVNFWERFWKALELTGPTSGMLSVAREAPARILLDPLRALVSGHRRSGCERTNSAKAPGPGDPGYM